MSFGDNKPFWTDFIALYKKQRPIWDTKNADYSYKPVKSACYNLLVDKAKEINSEADKKYVISKIESLRASFRRELNKMISLKRKGEVYKPNLWYFNLLLFTAEKEKVRECSYEEMAVDQEYKNEPYDETSQMDHMTRDTTSSPLISEQNSFSSSTSKQFPVISCKPSITEILPSILKKIPESRRVIKRGALKRRNDYLLNSPANCLCKETKSTVFGRNVAFQLEDLESRQQIIAEKLISDVLFHAKLGNLTEYSTILLEPNDRPFASSSNIVKSENHLDSINHSYNTPSNFYEMSYQNQDANTFIKQSNDFVCYENPVADSSSKLMNGSPTDSPTIESVKNSSNVESS